MDDEGPEDAEGVSGEAIGRALEVLQAKWGPRFLFVCDEARGWWAVKDGRIGSTLNAASPGELDVMLADQEGTSR